MSFGLIRTKNKMHQKVSDQLQNVQMEIGTGAPQHIIKVSGQETRVCGNATLDSGPRTLKRNAKKVDKAGNRLFQQSFGEFTGGLPMAKLRVNS